MQTKTMHYLLDQIQKSRTKKEHTRRSPKAKALTPHAANNANVTFDRLQPPVWHVPRKVQRVVNDRRPWLRQVTKKTHTHTFAERKKCMQHLMHLQITAKIKPTNQNKICAKNTLLQCVWSYMVIISLCTTFTKFTCAGADEDVADGDAASVAIGKSKGPAMLTKTSTPKPWSPGMI